MHKRWLCLKNSWKFKSFINMSSFWGDGVSAQLSRIYSSRITAAGRVSAHSCSVQTGGGVMQSHTRPGVSGARQAFGGPWHVARGKEEPPRKSRRWPFTVKRLWWKSGQLQRSTGGVSGTSNCFSISTALPSVSASIWQDHAVIYSPLGRCWRPCQSSTQS